MHDEHGERAVAVGGGMAGPGHAFHVVIPSIPGCGLSGPAYQLGWDTGRVVQAWTELVRSLGCTRYIAQGAAATGPQAGREDPAHADPLDRIRPGRSLRRHGEAQALRQRRVDIRPHVAFSGWPHIQLPVAVTRGMRWPCRG
jgi:hypothetical protein